MKKIICSLIAGASITALLGGCSLFQSTTSAISSYNFDEMDLIQLQEPEDGLPLIEVETTYGTFKAVLYPEYAPNTVNNFIERINDGFYTHKPIFTVMENAYFLTGASNDEGTAGVTSDGEPITNEYSVDLWPFKGALMSFFGGKEGYGDSRFFVVGNVAFSEDDAEYMRSITDDEGTQLVPDELIQAFTNNDCIVGLSGMYTVFGQTIEGFDVIEKLMAVKTDAADNESPGKPEEEIFIEKITLSEYKAENSD